LLYASSFPLGLPGCDNCIAYGSGSLHLQASTARAYDKTSDRLYGCVSYMHPSLAPDEDVELVFTLLTRSQQNPAGVLINQQAIEQGVHQLRHGEAEVAQRFLDLQRFTGLIWMHEAVVSAHLLGELHPFASADTGLVYNPLKEVEHQLTATKSLLICFAIPGIAIIPFNSPCSSTPLSIQNDAPPIIFNLVP
jgi:hypothetical protein